MLRKSARDSDGRRLTRTYVWHRGDGIVCTSYSLMPYFIDRDGLAPKRGRGLPDRIPCYLLARLALDKSIHRNGERLGSQLLASALLRAAGAARDVGGRYIVVDALDDAAVSFYVHHAFEPIPASPDTVEMASDLGIRYSQLCEVTPCFATCCVTFVSRSLDFEATTDRGCDVVEVIGV